MGRHGVMTERKRRGFAAVLAGTVLGAVVLVGCREEGAGTRYNRNLGTSEAPLLPTDEVVMDSTIRVAGSGQAIDLPALPEEIPSVDQVEARRAAIRRDNPTPLPVESDETPAVGDEEEALEGEDEEPAEAGEE